MAEEFSKSFPQSAEDSIGGRAVKLTPWTVFDLARAEELMKDHQRAEFLAKTRQTPLATEVLSGALAKIETTVVTYDDIIDTHQGKLILLWLSLRGENEPIEILARKVQLLDLERLIGRIARISGLGKDDGADPTTEASPPLVFQHGDE